MLYREPVYQSSKVQRLVATLSTELEYIAQLTNAKTTQQLAQVLQDIRHLELTENNSNTVYLQANNTRAIALAKNLHLHKRS